MVYCNIDKFDDNNDFNQLPCRDCELEPCCGKSCLNPIKDTHVLKIEADKLTPEEIEKLKKAIGNNPIISLDNSMIENINPKKCDNECLEDFLNYDIHDPEYLEILNGKRTIESIISWESLLMYMQEKNDKYCDKYNLCHECRSPLVKVREQEEIWGSKQVSEVYWVCPKCG
jgi:hypothetical protein